MFKKIQKDATGNHFNNKLQASQTTMQSRDQWVTF